MKRTLLSIAVLLVVAATSYAADPPQLINYEGILRDSNNVPLDGSFPMTFKFFDALTGGNELLVDTHTGVTVSGGLFNVELGNGSVTDGSGPGDYATLKRLFANFSGVYLEVVVNGETLTPRIRLTSSGFALNSQLVRGREIVSNGPLDLYVDVATGSDLNDGLSPVTAKQTIQAAIDAIPDVLSGEVTVWVAPGTYRERTLFTQRERVDGYHLIRLIGDQVGYPDNISVVLDGQTLDPAILEAAITVIDVGVEVSGFLVQNYTDPDGEISAVDIAFGGSLTISHSRIESNDQGVESNHGALVEIENSLITANEIGVQCDSHGAAVILTGTRIESNSVLGVEASWNSHVDFDFDPSDPPCVIQDNDLAASFSSVIENWEACTVSGAVTCHDCSSTGGTFVICADKLVPSDCVCDQHPFCAPGSALGGGGSDTVCTVTSDTGSCSASSFNDPLLPLYVACCCVCAP
jgi:hypothetical protein